MGNGEGGNVMGNSKGNGEGGNVMGNSNGGSNSMGERSGAITGKSVVSISISLSFSLVHTMVGVGSIAQHTDDILANILVFDLLGFYGLGGAHILGKRSAGLGH